MLGRLFVYLHYRKIWDLVCDISHIPSEAYQPPCSHVRLQLDNGRPNHTSIQGLGNADLGHRRLRCERGVDRVVMAVRGAKDDRGTNKWLSLADGNNNVV